MERIRKFRLGLVVNPLAGLGGPAALKGSDGVDAEARARGATAQAPERARRVLAALRERRGEFELRTWAGAMGAESAEAAGLAAQVVGGAVDAPTSAEDTVRAVRTLAAHGCDLLLFAGGDGTARDVVRALAELDRSVPVLGIPAGVKMHSGVFAVTPEGAARVVLGLVDGELVGVGPAEVRDIDEQGYREGVVRTRHFGELTVPSEPRWVQHTKVGGRESEPLVLEELGAWIEELIDPDDTWIFGPGSTTAAILERLGLAATLLGVDVVERGRVVLADATAEQLRRAVDPTRAHVLVTVIGGQGHVLGRGNQQLAPALLRAMGRERFHVVATRSKLAELEGRPLIVDSGDADLDAAWAGLLPVIVGYDDRVLYPVGDAGDA